MYSQQTSLNDRKLFVIHFSSLSSAMVMIVIIYHSICSIVQTSADQYSIQQTNQSKQNSNCNFITFLIYDGYEYVITDNKNDYQIQSSNLMPLILTTIESNLHDCLSLCRDRNECNGINYNGDQCQLITNIDDDINRLIRSNHSTTIDIHAKKICISDQNGNCAGKPWAFETVIGYTMSYPTYFHNTIVKRIMIKNIASVQECSERCLNEMNFHCRSVVYNEIDQHCILFNMNRQTIGSSNHIKTDGLKFVPTIPFTKQVHYIENKCIEEPNKFCDLRKIKKFKLKTADLIKMNVNTPSECRELCLSNSVTNPCKSFDFDSSHGICRISHLNEASTSHIIQPYIHDEDAAIFEISTCYNVTVLCQSKKMKIQIETSKLFSGKIYAQNRPRSCMNDILNRLDFELSIPYTDDDYTNNTADNDFLQCDTQQPTPGHFTNDIIIQHHDLVLTTKDLALGIFCKFDLHNSSIAQIDLKIQGEISTDKLKGTAKLPELSLHLVDQMGKDIDEVSIGDILRVQIRMSDEDTYGIFVRNLIAKDDQNPNNNFTLIDNKGCPAQMKMMREVRLLNENRKTLESYLEAFTFTGGSILIIQVEVETCLDKCKPVQCQVANGRSYPGVEMVTSYGRRKRRSASSNDDYDDQNDIGEVVSMTKLSKSLLIRKKREFVSTDLKITAGIDAKQHENANRTHTQRALDSFLAPYQKISISSKNYLCFEPTHLFVICVIACCAQISLFSLIFGIIIRVKKVPCPKRHLLTSSRIGASSWNLNPSTNNSSTPYNYMSSM
ncbi:hypothetical protein DERP_001442 [Dermatophagoides pteronyssinus]|uniref:Uncharacterized protein n=1 Tax=Dermatophagoides pteronyssinus TaxID=6956 RepID=A0ABQ8JF82_DERPT|nr:hypothetical protein DERP_001442 [Dermatophagoides pteronyssinus]